LTYIFSTKNKTISVKRDVDEELMTIDAEKEFGF
jgi:hypothetical protein